MIKNINGAAFNDKLNVLITPLNVSVQILKELNLIKEDGIIDNIVDRLHSIDFEQSLMFDENPHESYRNLLDFIVSTAQPFVSMIRDLEYYLEPYNSYNDIFTDALQPIRGLLNCIRALINVILMPAMCASLGVLAFRDEGILAASLTSIIFGAQSMLDSLSSFIRGIQQIATTPFAWLVKIPVRSLHTVISGFQPIEKNPDIIRLVNKINTGAGDSEKYAEQVGKIFSHYHEKGYKTNLNEEDVSKINDQSDSKTIISIFAKTPDENIASNEYQYCSFS